MGKYKYLDINDRKQIEVWYARGDRPADIADRLNVHIATIYKELARGEIGSLDENQRPAYSAEAAQKAVQANFKRRGRRSLTT